MIKLRIKEIEEIKKLHLIACEKIILANKRACISELEHIIYDGDAVCEELLEKIIIGPRANYFEMTNPLYLITNYYKRLDNFNSDNLYYELKDNGESLNVINKNRAIKKYVFEILEILERINSLTECVDDFETLRRVIDHKVYSASTKDNAKELKSFFKSAMIFSRDQFFNSLKKIFNYEEFCISNDDWDRKKLIKKMDIRVCPYCNRQHITNFDVLNNEVVTADLDHFYAKSIYPYLGLSLFNFIPSCQICNSRFKLAKDFNEPKHVYPYEEGFGNFGKFVISNDTDIKAFLGSGDKLDIDLMISETSDLKSKIAASNKTFNIKDIYQEHSELARGIIIKKSFFCESRQKELREWLSSMGFNVSTEELKNILYANYKGHKNFSDKALSKFTYDILEYLGEEV